MDIQLSETQKGVCLFLLREISISGGMSLTTLQEVNHSISPEQILEALNSFVEKNYLTSTQGVYRFTPEAYHALKKHYSGELTKIERKTKRMALLEKTIETIVLSFAKKVPALVFGVIGFLIGFWVKT